MPIKERKLKKEDVKKLKYLLMTDLSLSAIAKKFGYTRFESVKRVLKDRYGMEYVSCEEGRFIREMEGK